MLRSPEAVAPTPVMTTGRRAALSAADAADVGCPGARLCRPRREGRVGSRSMWTGPGGPARPLRPRPAPAVVADEPRTNDAFVTAAKSVAWSRRWCEMRSSRRRHAVGDRHDRLAVAGRGRHRSRRWPPPDHGSPRTPRPAAQLGGDARHDRCRRLGVGEHESTARRLGGSHDVEVDPPPGTPKRTSHAVRSRGNEPGGRCPSPWSAPGRDGKQWRRPPASSTP